jgi:DNA-directed RNA polymerase specialized sigma24 family protein
MSTKQTLPRRKLRDAQPPRDERIEDHDAGEYEDGYGDPWQLVRRRLNAVSIDALREAGKTVEAHSLDDEPVAAPDLSEAAKAALKGFPRRALTNIEETVLVERFYGDDDGPLSYAEIAKIYGISSASQVRKIEQRALEKMRKCMSAERNIFKAGPKKPGDK